MVQAPTTVRLVQCMRDAGWDVTPSWGGGIDSAEMDASQQSAWDAAFHECAESSGWRKANTYGEWTPEQVEQLYAQEVASHQCMVEHGWSSDEPPSKQTFIDTFATADQYFAMVPAIDNVSSRSDFEEIQIACPPPTWFTTIDGF